jgi:hypothetical protein
MTRGWRGAWSRKQVVDGVYQLDEGAWRDDVFYRLQGLGVGDWLGDVQGPGIQRARVPVVQDCAALQSEDLVWD